MHTDVDAAAIFAAVHLTVISLSPKNDIVIIFTLKKKKKEKVSWKHLTSILQ